MSDLLCADCGKAGFKDATGAAQHERREAAGPAPEGKERRAPAVKAEPTKEKPPRREHLLHRRII